MRERLVGELLEGRPPPEDKRVAELRPTLSRRGGFGLVEECLHTIHVELGRSDSDQVAGRLRHDQVRPEEFSELGDEVLERGRSRARRVLAPEGIDQPIGGDRAPRVQQKQREQAALLRAPELQGVSVATHLERTEQAEIEAVRSPLVPCGPRGRKLVRQPDHDELVDVLRPLEVLQPILAQVAQRDSLELVIGEDRGRRL